MVEISFDTECDLFNASLQNFHDELVKDILSAKLLRRKIIIYKLKINKREIKYKL